MKKKFGWPNFGQNQPELAPKLGLIFLEIAYNDSLQQCILSSIVKVKPMKIFLGTKFWPKPTKIGPETRFFAIFSSWVR